MESTAFTDISSLPIEPDYTIDPKLVGTFVQEEKQYEVRLIAKAKMPTRFGDFTLYGFSDTRDYKEHTVLVRGQVRDSEDLPVRVHSECHTGDVLGSLRCDCREQLEASLEYLGKQEKGMLIYHREEGRGIGLLNKIRAYRLQDHGLDTIQANEYLGFPAEARDYTVPAQILNIFGVKSIALLTNNPDKIEKLTSEGITVSGRREIIIPSNDHNHFYLETKRMKMRHMIDGVHNNHH